MSRTSSRIGSAENIRLGAFSQSCFRKLLDGLVAAISHGLHLELVLRSSYKFLTILISSEMDSAKRAPSYLIFDDVLIDTMLRSAIVLTVSIL